MKIIDGQITPENIHLAKGFDGVTTSQNTKVPTEVYEKLNKLHNVARVMITDRKSVV